MPGIADRPAMPPAPPPVRAISAPALDGGTRTRYGVRMMRRDRNRRRPSGGGTGAGTIRARNLSPWGVP